MTDLNTKYLRWNLFGEGHQETKSLDGHWYRDTVWFDGGIPCTRIVRRVGRTNPTLLIKHGGLHVPNDFKGLVNMMIVPDIGVFSRWEDDMLPDADLHERVRYVMLQKVRNYTELHVEPLTDKNVAENNHIVTSNRSTLSQLYIKYEDYSREFGLQWGSLPDMYKQSFENLVAIKVRRWNDPESLRKRERAKARKLAVKALELD